MDRQKYKVMSEQEQIEEILLEANAYGLRNEVKELAEDMINMGRKDMDRVEVYDYAYSKLIKRQYDGNSFNTSSVYRLHWRTLYNIKDRRYIMTPQERGEKFAIAALKWVVGFVALMMLIVSC